MAEPYRVVDSKRVFEGRRFTVRHDRIEYPGPQVVLREIIEHPNVACVAPVDDERNVLMVRQYRAATGLSLLEAVAGTMEPGEDPQACAQRELREETGFAAAHLEPLGDFWATPGSSTERMFVYLATGLRPDALPPDDDEHIVVERLPLAEALRMARTGQLHDAKTIAALLLAEHRLGGGRP